MIRITNRDMRLPGVTQILTVNMDYDAVGYDQMEVCSGVTGSSKGRGAAQLRAESLPAARPPWYRAGYGRPWP
jgi:hypothetical protein